MASVLTFKNLQDRVLAWIDEVGDTSTTLNLVKYALNEANKKRATGERWRFMLWPQVQTLNITVGQQNYVLHGEFRMPKYFWNRTAQDFMTEYDESTIKDSGSDWNNDATDQTTKFELTGRVDVAVQPAAASVLTLTSSDASDNGVRSVTVYGDTTTGYRSETILCNATGAVQFTSISKVTKAGSWIGILQLAAGATVLLNLFPEEAGRSYQQFHLLANPTAAQVVEYQFYRQPTYMTADDARPDIPPPFEEILVYDALLNFSSYNQYDATTVKLWLDKRDELLLELKQNYNQANSLEAAAHYTQYIPR
jgi:hypothetical protein